MDCTALLARLEGVRTNRTGWIARCPAHDDDRASLSIGAGEDGRLLLHCHAGCQTAAVVAALGLTLAELAANGGANGPGTGGDKSAAKGGVKGRAKDSTEKAGGRIVATYDYRDEAGKLLYQVVRLEPKGFRQRRPGKPDGWVWNLDGVRRVLYRLPELVAAGAGATVYVVEGEKDVERLRTLGLVATTNAGGAGKWLAEYAAGLIGRAVVILPDNDEPGRKHALSVAAALHGKAASVRIVSLPGLAAKGDVSDWLDAGGTVEELERLAVGAAEWTPVGNEAAGAGKGRAKSAAAWRPFPVEALPEPARSYVKAQAAAIGCDPCYVALPLLACLAATIGNARRIKLKAGWCEACVLWGAIVGESGTQKSPALSKVLEPLERKQAQALEEYAEAVRRYEQQAQVHAAELAEWKRKGAKRGDPPPEAPVEPVARRYIVSDITIEALADRLEENPVGLLLAVDELAGWVQSFNAYRGGKGGDAAKWLSIHRAGPLLVDRKTAAKKLINVPRAAVSITGGIQPDALQRALGREHFENGLAARLLLAHPPARPKRWSEATVSRRLLARVAAVFEGLLRLDMTQDEDGRAAPLDVPLTPGAKRAFVEFVNRHGAEQAALSGASAAAWSKLEGYAARLALIVHLTRWADGDPTVDSVDAVDEVSMAAGIALSEWFGQEALRIYGMLRETEAERDQRRLAELVGRLGGRATARELMRHGREYASAELAESALGGLVEVGWGCWEPVPPGPEGGKPTRAFVLHQSVDVDRTLENAGIGEVMSTSTGDEGWNPTSGAEGVDDELAGDDWADGDVANGGVGEVDATDSWQGGLNDGWEEGVV